jgi:hypothetical protein
MNFRAPWLSTMIQGPPARPRTLPVISFFVAGIWKV